MAGSPNANRTHLEFFDTVAAHGTGSDNEQEQLDFMAAPFIVRRVLVKATTALVGNSVYTLTWRPTAGSSTDEKTIAVWTQGALGADEMAVVDLNFNPSGETVIGAAGATSGFGISGSGRFDGADVRDLIMGPGGSINLNDDAGGTSGVADVWLEVEMLSLGNEQEPGGAALTFINPTQVGELSA